MCSSSGGQNYIIQHLVSSQWQQPLFHTAHFRKGDVLCGKAVAAIVMMPDAVKYNFDLLMMST